MPAFTFHARSEDDTRRLGQALAAALPATAVIALQGTLGAGKTRLVQALAAAVGVDPSSVTSPTFVLCQQYHAQRSIYHLDAYRLHDLDEFLELGVEEYFEGPGLTLIEWADRVAPCLPDERLEIQIEVTGPDSRRFLLIPHGPRMEDALARLDLATAEP
jgi:tRNA threonylcarbamoyladenosine biosynthesis protein TsaE